MTESRGSTLAKPRTRPTNRDHFWTLTEKLRIVEESSQPGMSVSYVARKHGIALKLSQE